MIYNSSLKQCSKPVFPIRPSLSSRDNLKDFRVSGMRVKFKKIFKFKKTDTVSAEFDLSRLSCGQLKKEIGHVFISPC